MGVAPLETRQRRRPRRQRPRSPPPSPEDREQEDQQPEKNVDGEEAIFRQPRIVIEALNRVAHEELGGHQEKDSPVEVLADRRVTGRRLGRQNAQAKCSVSMSVARGTISPQSESGVFETVTKSAVRKMLVTPGRSSNSFATSLSVACPATKVAGPPTDLPTENLTALGLGVDSTWITRHFLSQVRWEWTSGEPLPMSLPGMASRSG